MIRFFYVLAGIDLLVIIPAMAVTGAPQLLVMALALANLANLALVIGKRGSAKRGDGR